MRAIEAGFDAIERVEQALSLYREDSDLSRLNREGVIKAPHPDLVTVLQHAAHTSQLTQGAFDVTVQPLWRLFSMARSDRRMPSEEEVTLARTSVDWTAVEIDPSQVRLRKPGMAITLNGIAQGFAVDRVMQVLRAHGIEHALVDTGEFGAIDGNSNSQPWSVGIQHPRDAVALASRIALKNRCLATSGDYATSFSTDRRHHHIFDPHTGYSPSEIASASVLAATAIQADALSTALLVLGLERGMELIEGIADVDAFLIDKQGRTFASSNFPSPLS